MIIKQTEDYDKLVEMFIRHELEFSAEEAVPTDLVKCWAAIDEDKVIGGAVLALREEEYILDGISVEPEYRGQKVGERLLDTVVDEVKKRGGKRIYLVARAPGFFRRNGFTTVERNQAPNFFECATCPQYKVSCFPEVMLREV